MVVVNNAALGNWTLHITQCNKTLDACFTSSSVKIRKTFLKIIFSAPSTRLWTLPVAGESTFKRDTKAPALLITPQLCGVIIIIVFVIIVLIPIIIIIILVFTIAPESHVMIEVLQEPNQMCNIVLTIILIILSYQPRILTAPTFCGQNLSHVMLIRASCAKFWPICIKSIQRVLPSLFVLSGNLIWPELINQHYIKIMVQKAQSRHLATNPLVIGLGTPPPLPKNLLLLM